MFLNPIKLNGKMLLGDLTSDLQTWVNINNSLLDYFQSIGKTKNQWNQITNNNHLSPLNTPFASGNQGFGTIGQQVQVWNWFNQLLALAQPLNDESVPVNATTDILTANVNLWTNALNQIDQTRDTNLNNSDSYSYAHGKIQAIQTAIAQLAQNPGNINQAVLQYQQQQQQQQQPAAGGFDPMVWITANPYLALGIGAVLIYFLFIKD